jgi:hypothetical protein
MEVYPKFVVKMDNELGLVLCIAKCTYHKELIADEQKPKGGGWWRLDTDTKTFTLYGDSHDLGAATLEDIQTCINTGKVFGDKYEISDLSNDYNFCYDTRTEIIDLKKQPN